MTKSFIRLTYHNKTYSLMTVRFRLNTLMCQFSLVGSMERPTKYWKTVRIKSINPIVLGLRQCSTKIHPLPYQALLMYKRLVLSVYKNHLHRCHKDELLLRELT